MFSVVDVPPGQQVSHTLLPDGALGGRSATGHKTQIVFRTFKGFCSSRSQEFKEVLQMKRHNTRPPIISGNNSFSPSGLLQIAC